MQRADAIADILRQQTGRLTISLLVLAACTALLWQRFAALDTEAIQQAFRAVSVSQWLAAMAAVAISYGAIGQYDRLVLRHLAIPHDPATARRAGITAIALSQTVGLGVVSGALVRWRMLPGTSFGRAMQISLAVGVSFLLAAGGLAAVVTAVLHAPQGLLVASIGALGCIGLCLWRPAGQPLGVHGCTQRLRWPNLFALTGMVGLAAVDVGAAGLALWWLVPDTISAAVLAPAFLLALGAGLVSGTPAGLGAFEVVLLAQMPDHDPEALLAAVVAWRLVYFALPSLLALPALAIGPKSPPPPMAVMPQAQASLWPEAGLQRQGRLSLDAATGWTLGRTGHALVAFGPVAHPKQALARLWQMARAELRMPVLYKAPPRLAAHAHRSKMRVALVGGDAWLTPATFTLSHPKRSGLRRKLRHAGTAGVRVSHNPEPPMLLLAAIATGWAVRHRGERGFSMGRFCPDYLRGQRVYTAVHQGAVVAFVSFHATPVAWVLDLMRAAPTAPDGTMHALVHCALQEAASQGVPQFGLAAVPLGAFADAPIPARAMARLANGAGLLQFKAAFAPTWRPLYLAAPNKAALALAAMSIGRAVHWPEPVSPKTTA